MAVNLADFSTATAMAEFKTRHQLWYSSQENASLATYMADPANAVLLAVSTWDTLIGFTNNAISLSPLSPLSHMLYDLISWHVTICTL